MTPLTTLISDFHYVISYLMTLTTTPSLVKTTLKKMSLYEPFHTQIVPLGNHSSGYSVVFQVHVLFSTLYMVVLIVNETPMHGYYMTISMAFVEKQ